MAKKGQIMKINRLTALLIAAILVSGALLADQQAYISESNALRAAELLVPGTELQSFCEPCGDLEPADVAITSVEAVATGYESFWEVLVNGTGIDLAYTYIAYEGHWQNMAMILGLEVSDVSRFIGSGATTVEEDLAMTRTRFEGVEMEMEAVLDEASINLDEQTRRLLEKSQSTWFRYREAMVEYEITMIDHEGEIERARYFILERLTRQRIKDLDRSRYQ